MIILLVMLVVLGVMCWALCKLISVFVGVMFMWAGMIFLIRMTKQILK